MSDSGRQIGDCKHAKVPAWCVDCLRERLSRVTEEILAAVAKEREEIAQMVAKWPWETYSICGKQSLPQAIRERGK